MKLGFPFSRTGKPHASHLPPPRSEPVAQPVRRAPSRRFFAAAASEHFIGWEVPDASADATLYPNQQRLLARARDLARNNGYVVHFLRLLQNNVIGRDGLTFRATLKAANGRGAGTADKKFNAALENFWWQAGKLKNSPTPCGRYSRRDFGRLWIRNLAVDGEVLVLRKPGFGGNKFRYAKQFIDSARLDSTLNGRLTNGNLVKMGVELDDNERPVAYHILKNHPSEGMFAVQDGGRDRVRVSAEFIEHTFLPERPGQTRGVSWFVSSAVRSQMLDKIEEAVTVGLRVAAAKMGFYEKTEDYDGQALSDEEEDGTLTQTVTPGQFEELPKGVKVTPFDPDYPPADFEEFHKIILRGISSSLGGDYNSVANNMEGVNYTSSRMNMLNIRDGYKDLQAFFAEHHEEPDFLAWLAVQTDLNPAFSLDPEKVRRLIEEEAYAFHARGWQWVDPAKEMAAHKEALAAKLTSPQRIVAEVHGTTIDEILDEWQVYEQELKARQLELPLFGQAPPKPETPVKEEGGDDA